VSGTHWEYIAGSASFGQDSYCIYRGICPLVTLLCLAYVGVSDGHSDQQLLMIVWSLWKYVDVNTRILVNKTVHRSSFLLFTICFTDAAKLAKSSFQQFQIAKPISW
jgi:hypothetical protein